MQKNRKHHLNHDTNKIALIGLIIAVLLLSACDQDRKVRDLKNYVSELRDASSPDKNKQKVKVPSLPKPAIYQAKNLRIPFQSASLSTADNKAISNPLQRYPLSMLRLVGLVLQHGAPLAYIMMPDNKLYTIRVGDMIGDRDGKVTRIDSDHIEVIEKNSDESVEAKEKIVILQLKDGAA